MNLGKNEKDDFATMTAESFPLQQIFDQIEQELGVGMVPRIFRLLESQPALLMNFWGQFRTVVLHGYLPRVLKEMIGLVVATATRCDYVRAVHLHSLTLQGTEQKTLEAVSRGDYKAGEISTMTQDVLQFTALAATTRAAYNGSSSDDSRWQELRQETTSALDTLGLEEEEKLELVATVALFEQICMIANLLALDPSQP